MILSGLIYFLPCVWECPGDSSEESPSVLHYGSLCVEQAAHKTPPSLPQMTRTMLHNICLQRIQQWNEFSLQAQEFFWLRSDAADLGYVLYNSSGKCPTYKSVMQERFSLIYNA